MRTVHHGGVRVIQYHATLRFMKPVSASIVIRSCSSGVMVA